jgi:hypothetical protein
MATNGAKGGMTAGALLACAVALLALPSAVLAFSTGFAPQSPEEPAAPEASEAGPASAQVRLARAIPLRSLGDSLGLGQMFPFTPAKTPNRPDRSVTVAVRVDALVVRGIRLRGTGPERLAEAGPTPVKIAPTAFNLGVSRGYRGFAPGLVAPGDTRASELPDLTGFSIAPGVKPTESRFSPRIVIDEKQAAGRAPRTFAGDREDRVDVGGSYRVTRNLDVTAGVRYSQDQRDRLKPLTDGQQDSQAVYVGTQFRF